ncbi:MAG: nitrous oxide-stimulated promoter family protein [Bacteroidales bacterium]|nr:nitrous oxide-stimulated promoter family protein [Bacteroidales bacterium]MBQ2331643.1 nitrous oxide-stimulated promoter family protein [Bacteroidales bacterium]
MKRTRIDEERQVMRFSGPRMFIYHPLAAIKHLMR